MNMENSSNTVSDPLMLKVYRYYAENSITTIPLHPLSRCTPEDPMRYKHPMICQYTTMSYDWWSEDTADYSFQVTDGSRSITPANWEVTGVSDAISRGCGIGVVCNDGYAMLDLDLHNEDPNISPTDPNYKGFIVGTKEDLLSRLEQVGHKDVSFSARGGIHIGGSSDTSNYVGATISLFSGDFVIQGCEVAARGSRQMVSPPTLGGAGYTGGTGWLEMIETCAPLMTMPAFEVISSDGKSDTKGDGATTYPYDYVTGMKEKYPRKFGDVLISLRRKFPMYMKPNGIPRGSRNNKMFELASDVIRFTELAEFASEDERISFCLVVMSHIRLSYVEDVKGYTLGELENSVIYKYAGRKNYEDLNASLGVRDDSSSQELSTIVNAGVTADGTALPTYYKEKLAQDAQDRLAVEMYLDKPVGGVGAVTTISTASQHTQSPQSPQSPQKPLQKLASWSERLSTTKSFSQHMQLIYPHNFYDASRGVWWLYDEVLGYWKEFGGTGTEAYMLQLVKNELLRSGVISLEKFNKKGLWTDVLTDWKTDVARMSGIRANEMLWGKSGSMRSKVDWLINVQNGVYDVINDVLLPHSPLYEFEGVMNGSWVDIGYQDDVVTGFIESIALGRADTSLALSHCIGLCSVSTTSAEVIMVLNGVQGSGKSTFIGALHSLLGSRDNGGFAVTKTLEDMESPHSSEHFPGATMVSIHEVENTRNKSGKLKSISSGNVMTSNPKGISERTYYGGIQIVIGSNKTPRFSDGDDSIRARLRIISFIRSYRETTGADKFLAEKLATPSALSAILALAASGLRDLRSRGMHVPHTAESEEIIEEILLESDPVLHFLSETVTMTGVWDDTVQSGELYKLYQDFARAGGYAQKSAKSFTRDMKSHRCAYYASIRFDGVVRGGYRGMILNTGI